MKMLKMLPILVTLCLICTSGLSAHNARLDSYGGHNDRASGNYHFHAGPLAGNTYSSKAEAVQALRGSRRQGDPNSDSDSALVGSIKSNKYHYPSCVWAKKIHDDNIIRFSGPEDARSNGYVPCKVCKPR